MRTPCVHVERLQIFRPSGSPKADNRWRESDSRSVHSKRLNGECVAMWKRRISVGTLGQKTR